jgi:thiopurine S-methyltransferase
MSQWHERWRSNQIAFHQREVNPLLLRFADRWIKDERKGPVLVPLAGKTLDMTELATRGLEVVGVELVEEAVRAYFVERGIEPELEAGRAGPIYRGGGVSFHAADFFDAAIEASFPLIYDRAALIALPEPIRVRYAERIRSLLRAGGRMLLITVEYGSEVMKGPPFSVSAEEVARHYGALGRIEKLSEEDALEPRFIERGVRWMRESAWLVDHDAAHGKDH